MAKVKKWITVHPHGKENKGQPIPVMDGQSKGEAVNAFIDKHKSEQSKTQKEKVKELENKYTSDSPIEPKNVQKTPSAANGFRAKRDSFRKKLENKPDGTYDYDTGEPVSFEGQKKWQVSFQTTESEDETSDGYITDDEYDALVDKLSKQTGSKPYLGKFEVPETSFVCETLQQALDIAKEYNQKSVWDWKKMKEVKNKYFDPTKNTVKGGKQ